MDKWHLLSGSNMEGWEPYAAGQALKYGYTPNCEMSRAKRRNGSAYQHRRRRFLTGGHAIIINGRGMEYQRSHSMFLTH
jgi:hypothetical protein